MSMKNLIKLKHIFIQTLYDASIVGMRNQRLYSKIKRYSINRKWDITLKWFGRTQKRCTSQFQKIVSMWLQDITLLKYLRGTLINQVIYS